jgi:hypothetical protein
MSTTSSALDWRAFHRDLASRGNDTTVSASERRVANLAAKLVNELGSADPSGFARLLASLDKDADTGDLAHEFIAKAERRNLVISTKDNKRLVRPAVPTQLTGGN